MKTLIVYGSKYGCTEQCAKILINNIEGEVNLLNLKGKINEEISDYERIIIGGSIYIGKIQKAVSQFCSENLDLLLNKKIGLFICCMKEGDKAITELKESFPNELFEKAVAKDYFGGEFNFKKMSFIDRMIVKKVTKVEKDISNILKSKIDMFAQRINNA